MQITRKEIMFYSESYKQLNTKYFFQDYVNHNKCFVMMEMAPQYPDSISRLPYPNVLP